MEQRLDRQQRVRLHDRGLEVGNQPGQYTYASTTTPDMVWSTSNTVHEVMVVPKASFTDHCRLDITLLQRVHYQRQEVTQTPSWATGRKEWAIAMKHIQHTLEYVAATVVITTSNAPLRAAALRETKELHRRTVMATSLWWRSAAVAMTAHAHGMAVMPKKKQMVSPQEALKHVHRAIEAVW